ncbi:transient receptor potential cation channel subfamily A member 1-like, partial [Rhagoletis pomonella]
MVTHGRVELLAHPLSQKYLQMKWNSYGKYFHLANLLIYSIFLLFVTVFSSLMMNGIEIRPLSINSSIVDNWNVSLTNDTILDDQKNLSNTDWSQNPAGGGESFAMKYGETYECLHHSTALVFCAIAIVVYIACNSLREILQMYQQRLHYIFEIVNLISWVLHISALIMVWPVFCSDGNISTVHYSAAAVA